MTSVAINLRRRAVKDSVSMPAQALKDILESGDRERLWLFMQAVKDVESFIHDAHWLELITSHPSEEAIKWVGLRARVDALDREKEGVFRVTYNQAQLIKGRLKDGAFIKSLGRLHPCFAQFVMAFAEAGKFNLIDDADLWDEPKEESNVSETE